MNKSTVIINGELDDVMAVTSPFTHEVKSKFFNGLGESKVVGSETGESAGSGYFVSHTILESENSPTIDSINLLLSEYPDSKVVVFLNTEVGSWLASNDGAVAI